MSYSFLRMTTCVTKACCPSKGPGMLCRRTGAVSTNALLYADKGAKRRLANSNVILDSQAHRHCASSPYIHYHLILL